MNGVGVCGRCRREFLWARTVNGRRQPVDPEPRPDGNLAVYRDALGNLRARVVSGEHPIETWERPAMPHAATCAPPKGETVARTRNGALSLADARRRAAARRRQTPR